MDFIRSPGLWLFVGGIEALLLIHVAEFLYPGYSVSEDYISHLGVGPTATRVVFTVALVVFGLMALRASYLLRQRARGSRLWLLLALSAAGAIGVGVFDMDNFRELHALSALLAFVSGNAAAIYSRKAVRPPLSHLFVALGATGLAALVLFIANLDLGIGLGGMERMVFYPEMFWVLAYGTYLMAEEGVAEKQ